MPVLSIWQQKEQQGGSIWGSKFSSASLFCCACMCFYCFLQWQEMLEISYFLLNTSSSFRTDLRKSNPMPYIQCSGICSIENKIITLKKKTRSYFVCKVANLLQFAGNKWKFVIFMAKKWETLMNFEARKFYIIIEIAVFWTVHWSTITDNHVHLRWKDGNNYRKWQT